MLAVLAGFASTYVWVYSQTPPAHFPTGALRIPAAPLADTAAHLFAVLPYDFEAALPWLTPIWLFGVLLFYVRAGLSWAAAQRLRRRGACCAPSPWPERLSQLASQMRVSRQVLLLESCLTQVPVVIGHLRPAILVPLGLLTGLPAAQVEAILLHELAHVRRLDYLVNVIQTLVESLLFYHPAIWWISAEARAERENCCDDLVVAVSGNVPEYAAALAALEQNRRPAYAPALAANGGSLMKRIHRLLDPQQRERVLLPPLVLATLVAVSAACLSFAWQTKPQAPPPAVAPSQAAVLDNPWRKWLNEDVAYIVSDEERKAFRALQSDEEHERFIQQFWERRDPTPGTARNEMQEEHYRRLRYVNEHFSSAGSVGWKTDRGRMYVTWGPADEVESHPSGGAYKRPAIEGGASVVTVPFEQWIYRHIDSIGDNVIVEFVDPQGTGEYRMTRDPSEKVR